jgi:hypothetical protein
MSLSSISIILIGLISWLSVFRLWDKHRRGISLTPLEKVGLIITIVAGVIGVVAGAIYIIDYFGVPLLVTIPLGMIWIILITSTTIVIAFATISLIRRMSIKWIEGVQAHIFFPKDTPITNKNLDYHKKHFRYKLIINHKTKTPQAYYMPTDSYGWKLIKKHSDLWISEIGPPSNDPNFTKKWCEKHGYNLNPWKASKKDLLARALD